MAARADKNTTHINKQAAGKWLVGLYQRIPLLLLPLMILTRVTLILTASLAIN